jgi:hypothetical protein
MNSMKAAPQAPVNQIVQSSFLTADELSRKCDEQIASFWIAMNTGEGGNALQDENTFKE